MARTVRLKIEGMYCPLCALGIEKKLNVVAGVEIRVSYPEGIGILKVTDNAKIESLINYIEEVGRQVIKVEQTAIFI